MGGLIRLCDIIFEWFPQERYEKYGDVTRICGHNRTWGDGPACEIRLYRRNPEDRIISDDLIAWIYEDAVEAWSGKGRGRDIIPAADPALFDKILSNLDGYLDRYFTKIR